MTEPNEQTRIFTDAGGVSWCALPDKSGKLWLWARSSFDPRWHHGPQHPGIGWFAIDDVRAAIITELFANPTMP